MITPNTVLTRTEQGALLLQSVDNDLSRTERLLLVMVNGEITVGEISTRLYSIPLRRLTEALDYLLDRGLISEERQSVHSTPNKLRRQELEAFLRPAELDPTTAMIANHEMQAVLNAGTSSATVSQVFKKDQNIDSIIEKHIVNKVKHTHSQTQTSINTNSKPQSAAQTHIVKQDVSVEASNVLKEMQPYKQAAHPHKKKTKEPGTTSSLIGLLLFSVVWFGLLWLIRTK